MSGLVEHIMRAERWLPVVGYEGYYEVSDHGRVRSLARRVPHRTSGSISKPERILRAAPRGDGRMQVGLCKDGESKAYKVHRLVLLAFVGPTPHGMESCHNNGDHTDNRLSNLRWDTKKSNQADRRRHSGHHNADKTECKYGHAYTPENTLICNKGRGRRCRTCNIATHRRSRRRIAERKAAA